MSLSVAAEGGANLHLDGGAIDYDGSGVCGVAPNNTDFTWKFMGWPNQ